MSAVTTHVLDASLGRPGAHIPVRLELLPDDEAPTLIAVGETDDDGRITQLGPDQLPAGTYRLVFDTAQYFEATRTPAFYPRVEITFRTGGTAEHYHVPVLLSPFAYSTYRGS